MSARVARQVDAGPPARACVDSLAVLDDAVDGGSRAAPGSAAVAAMGSPRDSREPPPLPPTWVVVMVREQDPDRLAAFVGKEAESVPSSVACSSG